MDKVLAVGKVLAAAAGFILAALNEHIDLVPVQYRGLVTGLIAVLTLVGVYHAPYAPLGRNRGSTGKLGGKHPHPGPQG
jgi:hypothetical protein